jgi:glycosyltransferase involved in cell wall biosynthesis
LDSIKAFTGVKVSVILLAHNEENKIGEAIRRVSEALKSAGLDYEIIVVNDGSADSTAVEVLKCTKNNDRVKLVNHSRNLGKGAVVMTGFTHSIGDLVAFIAASLTTYRLAKPLDNYEVKESCNLSR